MGSGKPKQFTRPPKKQKPKAANSLETADDFQEAADFEENAGGKHRVGDPVKSGRAFVRALDVYDKGLRRHPNNFDLAYNKARLQLEISQQPILIQHIGIPSVEWLQHTVLSHRYALRLSKDNADVLFNTAQVLSSLAEELSENEESSEAVQLLHEALELLSSCLARQEMMLEQHQLDFPDAEDGGVALDSDEQQASSSEGDVSEQSATVETPVSPGDLLDTIHASLSALTTLVPLANPAGLDTLGDMAHNLTEIKSPGYIGLLPAENQPAARLHVALDRAVFVAAFANAQFENNVIELETYVARLGVFDIPAKDQSAEILCAEADSQKEFVLTMIDRFDETPDLPAALCWKQLSTAQDLLSKATKLVTTDAQERMAEMYASKGDIELLRHRLVNIPKVNLSDVVRRSAPTLVQNAQKFFKGASQYARRDGDDETYAKSVDRGLVAANIEALMYGGGSNRSDVSAALQDCVDEGLVSQSLAQALVKQSFASKA